MDYKAIESLLEMYHLGETSLEEEAYLIDQFEHSEVQEKYPQEAAIFRYFAIKRAEALEADVFEKMALNDVIVPADLKVPDRFSFRTISRIAAVVFLLMLSGLFVYHLAVQKPIQAEVYNDSIEEPEKAYEEAKQAMLMISTLMNAGLEETQKIASFHEAEEKIKQPKL